MLHHVVRTYLEGVCVYLCLSVFSVSIVYKILVFMCKYVYHSMLSVNYAFMCCIHSTLQTCYRGNRADHVSKLLSAVVIPKTAKQVCKIIKFCSGSAPYPLFSPFNLHRRKKY